LFRKMEVEHYINEITHKALRFWIKMWCLTQLYGRFERIVDDPPVVLSRYNNGIKASVR
jgi:hypothetical protein